MTADSNNHTPDHSLIDHLEAHVERNSSPVWVTGFNDLKSGLKRFDLWSALAAEDLQQRYTRAGLGMFWIGISYAVFLTVYIAIFGPLAGDEMPERVIYITTGFLVWQYMSSAVTDGLHVFIRNAHWIRASRLPYSVFCFQSFANLIINFCYTLAVSVAVLVYFRSGFSENTSVITLASSCLGLLNVLISAIWIQIIVGIICLRFRDFLHFVTSVIRIGFFLTPVIWEGERLGELGKWIETLNPLTYYIEVVRGPILDGVVSSSAWAIVLSVNICGMLLAPLVLSYTYRKIPFWI